MAKKDEITEEYLEQCQQHSAAGGRHEALKEVEIFLQARAGELFIQGKDQNAELVRELSKRVTRLRDEAEKALDVQIGRALSRRK